jgi:hypothetical protein
MLIVLNPLLSIEMPIEPQGYGLDWMAHHSYELHPLNISGTGGKIQDD